MCGYLGRSQSDVATRLGKARGLGSFTGNFTALDARTNKIAWRKNFTRICASGSFTTGGGLVFTGDRNNFIAYNAMTGDLTLVGVSAAE